MKVKSVHEWGRDTAKERYACGGKMQSGGVPLPKPRPAGKEPQPSDLYSPEQVKTLEGQK